MVFIASFWGKTKGGNFVYKLLHLWSDILFPLAFIRPIKIIEDPILPDTQYVFVCNHISLMDAPLTVKVIRNKFRPLGKIELKNIPIFGLIYRIAVIVVDRSNAENRQRSVGQLKEVIKKGISILIFPEGTYNETSAPMKNCFDGAFRIAIETQTPIKPIIYPDTFARMNGERIFTFNPGICRAVFLETIPVKDLTIDDLPRLKQQVVSLMEAKLIEYKASWIQ